MEMIAVAPSRDTNLSGIGGYNYLQLFAYIN